MKGIMLIYFPRDLVHRIYFSVHSSITEACDLVVLAALRVIERGVHMLNGKQFYFKFPAVMKEKVNNEEDSGSYKISNEDCENVVEIHGDVGGLGMESLEMYLENSKRSGGGEIKEMNLDANPPWVAFLESKGKANMFFDLLERIISTVC